MVGRGGGGNESDCVHFVFIVCVCQDFVTAFAGLLGITLCCCGCVWFCAFCDCVHFVFVVCVFVRTLSLLLLGF